MLFYIVTVALSKNPLDFLQPGDVGSHFFMFKKLGLFLYSSFFRLSVDSYIVPTIEIETRSLSWN